MRGVKYRIWDKENEVMMTDWQNFKFIKTINEDSFLRLGVSNGRWTLYVESFENYVVMQCVGTKDKNGIEIYVGDIVESEGCIGFVEYDANRLGYIKRLGTGVHFISSYDKVIGNIYKNPELLNDN